MQTRNRLFDDMARLANGATSVFAGMKDEMDAMVRRVAERILADMDLVSREEFEAVRSMAAKARLEQGKLEKRLAALEGKPARAKKAGQSKKTAPRRKARAKDA